MTSIGSAKLLQFTTFSEPEVRQFQHVTSVAPLPILKTLDERVDSDTEFVAAARGVLKLAWKQVKTET